MHSNLQENITNRHICKVAESILKFYYWYAVKPLFLNGLQKEKHTGKMAIMGKF
jgi:hypothetical protein